MEYQCLPLYHENVYEPDKIKRPCSIMLNTRPLDSLHSTPFCDTSTQHFGLVAYFKEGDKLMTFEAGQGDDGKIEVGLANGVWADDPRTRRYNLGIIYTSPNELFELARRHYLNGRLYSATRCNCQDWVKVFARMISPIIGNALANCQIYTEEFGTVNAVMGHTWVKSFKSSSFLFSKSYQGFCPFARKSFESSGRASYRMFSL